MDQNKKQLEEYLRRLQQMESELTDGADEGEFMRELNGIIDGLTKEAQTGIVKNAVGATLKFVNKSDNPDPSFAKEGDSGFDVRAFIPFPTHVPPMKVKTIPTGLYFEVKKGLEVQIRSRSGLSRNKQVMVLNSPGTLDSGYRGELEIIFANFGENTITIENGDRIAQAVVCPVYGEGNLVFEKVQKLSESERSDGGFGHTGVK